jgi:ApaG protein
MFNFAMQNIYAVLLFIAVYQRTYTAFHTSPMFHRAQRTQGSVYNKNSFISSISATGVSDSGVEDVKALTEMERKDLWKSISSLEKQAVDLLCEGQDKDIEQAYKLFSQSASLKKTDPFLQLADSYAEASAESNEAKCKTIMSAMKTVNVPPHLSSLAELKKKKTAKESKDDSNDDDDADEDGADEEVDPGSTFSDTVTEKIRVKVNSFYDQEKSDPANGKYMFWYKVAIYNEGAEPVQIVARMWEIEKCKGEKEVVRGAGIMSTQPIIPPGDVFTYQSVCPLKLFPPKGKRVLGSMTGAYTLCKGNMGQHNFTVKVAKFNLILPDPSSKSS